MLFNFGFIDNGAIIQKQMRLLFFVDREYVFLLGQIQIICEYNINTFKLLESHYKNGQMGKRWNLNRSTVRI